MDFNNLKEEIQFNEDSLLPENITAVCETCGWVGLLVDCGQEMESEGWEYPSYMVATCPKCGECVEY